AAAWLQRTEDSARRLLLLQHPVQGGIGESGVELGEELHVLGGELDRVDAVGAGRSDHFRRIVDPKHCRATLDDLPRQRTFTAANVENAFTRLRIEQVERGPAKLGDERADLGIIGGIPLAGRGGRLAQSVATKSRYAPSSMRPSSSCGLSSFNLKNQPFPLGSVLIS